MKFCPNINTQEWSDLVSAVGESHAHYLWDANKGNSLNLTPQGEPSLLYNSLLEQLGDPISALKEKSKFYSLNYLISNGNWTTTPTLFKGALDTNNEPVLLAKEDFSKQISSSQSPDLSINEDLSVENTSSFVWNEEQQSAINKATDFLDNKIDGDFFVIEGKAGTGKTTIARAILSKYKNKNILIGALSNVAKDVIKDSVKKDLPRANYKTIAGMLGMVLDMETNMFVMPKSSYGYTPEPPISYADIIVIDEASMVNEEMMELIKKYKPKRTKVLFLGDIGQLAPIRSSKNPYYKGKEKLLTKKSPAFELEDSHKSRLITRVRQGEGSVILPFADHFWNNSQSLNPQLNPAPLESRINQVTSQGALLFTTKSKDIIDESVDIFKVAISTKNANLIKFVTYRVAAKDAINSYIHRAIFGNDAAEFNTGEPIIFSAPFGEDLDNGYQTQIISATPFIKTFDGKNTFHAYDVIIDYTNEDGFKIPLSIPVISGEDKEKFKNYVANLFNEAKNARDKRDPKASKMFVDAYKVKDSFADIDYSYAITSHKSQGSTYDIVVVHESDIMGVSKSSIINKSESIYTGITRARNITVMISAVPVADMEMPNILDTNNSINEAKKTKKSIPNTEIVEDISPEELFSEDQTNTKDDTFVPWREDDQSEVSQEEVDDVTETITLGESEEESTYSQLPSPFNEEVSTQNNTPQTLEGQMTYDYNGNKRSDVQSSSTIDAIVNGERTATTRYEEDGNLDYWKTAKVGDLIEFSGKNNKRVIVRVTKPLYKLQGSGMKVETWSKLEGWSSDYFERKVRPKISGAWQLQYEFVEANYSLTEKPTYSQSQLPLPFSNQQEIFSWGKKGSPSYEVSSKGDSRFSALYAKLNDGRTIEEAYQLDIKGYRSQGNDWRLGKGKEPLIPISGEELWNKYKALWNTYLDENPNLESELRKLAKGKMLTDMFANTSISQARALAELLNERPPKKDPDPDPTPKNDPSLFTNHSGGANGSDSQWDIIGSKYGMINNIHYYHGSKTPKGNTPISDDDLAEGVSMVKKTYSVLARPNNEKYHSLHGRNWFQVKNSDAVFAIGNITKPSEIDSKGYVNKARKQVVTGGTGYAVEMAIQIGKPVYVFNQANVGSLSKGWYTWDGSTFVKIDTPTLTKNFAGIGTREIDDSGKEAIKNVYEKTFGNSSTPSLQSKPENLKLEYEDSAIREFLSKTTVEGLTPIQQYKLVSSLALFANKLINQDKSPKEAFIAYFETLLPKIKALKANDPNHLALIETVEKNRSKIERKTIEYIQKIRDVKLDFDEVDEVDMNENDQSAIKERTDYSDNYSISVNHKNTASGRLKSFFSGIVNLRPDGKPEINAFGLPEIIPFDFVYNNIQAAVGGLSPEFSKIVAKLEELSLNKPFFKSVILDLNKATDQVKNEFVKNMTKHAIEMKMLMWSEKDNQYKFEIYNANSSSVLQTIITDWKTDLKSKDIFDVREVDGESFFTKEFLDEFIGEFDSFVSNIKPSSIRVLNLNNIVGLSPVSTNLLANGNTELPSPLTIKNITPKENEVFKVTFGSYSYSATLVDGNLQFSPYTPPSSGLPSAEKLREWLSKVGLTLNQQVADKIVNGDVYFSVNKRKASYKDLFKKGGAFEVFVGEFRKRQTSEISIEDSNPLDDSIVKDIAKVEVPYAINKFSSSFRTSGKSISTFTNNNFLQNRIREIKNFDSNFINTLMNNPFSRSNFLLRHFVTENQGAYSLELNEGYNATDIYYLSLEALKKRSARPRDNREFHNLSPTEREVTRINLFMANSNSYNMNGEIVRNVSSISPTMSDKTRVMITDYQARVFSVNNENQISTSDAEYLFTYLVKPEIDRMKAYESGSKPDIKNYNPMFFYLLPSLNKIPNIILNNQINPDIEVAGDLRTAVLSEIKNLISEEVASKLRSWTTLGITSSENGNVINSKYLKDIAKGSINNAAADYVINSMLMNAGFFQSFIGDPALYEKGDIRGTYDNIGKRLAMLIAPGYELAESRNLLFKFATIKDTKIDSDFNKYYQSLGYNYSGINAGDAQEYTTWKEHLRVLHLQGWIGQSNIAEISDYIERGVNIPDNLMKMVLKPLKPVYVQSTFNNMGVEKRWYIKSSSIPLIPQLTKGFQIDKLRIAMENPKTGVDRVAYESAVKVGIDKVDTIFDNNGSISDNIVFSSTVELPYSGYKIQQELPNKDKLQINDGTQQRSLLFLNLDEVSGFKYNGESYTGKELKNIYNQKYKTLYEAGHRQLLSEITQDGVNLNLKKLQQVLLKEGYSRGFSENAIASFEIEKSEVGKDRFIIPLWLSPHSDKIEALFNSIVTNRVIKKKMPGMSMALVSENGFKLVSNDTISSAERNKMLLTDQYSATLKPQRLENGVIRPAQVLVPERLYVKGQHINLRDYLNADGRVDSSKLPKEALELFGFRIPTQGPNSMAYIEIVGFVPKSMGDVIIAPKEFVHQMGSDFDFDKLYAYTRPVFSSQGSTYLVSKENKTLFKNAKLDSIKAGLRKTLDEIYNSAEVIEPIQNEGESSIKDFILDLMIQADYSSNFIKSIKGLMEEHNLRPETADQINEILNSFDELYFEEYFEEIVTKSEIFDIRLAVLKNPSEVVQKQIMQPLEYGLLQNGNEGLDIVISNLKSKRLGLSEKAFLPLSESYQEEKFSGATSGKSGVSVFSLASTFNAAVQSTTIGEEIYTTHLVAQDNGKMKTEIYSFNLFGKKSSGNIASPYLINSTRPKSEVIAAYQSASVDNEKQRILEKLNINSNTFGVINYLAMNGFSEVEISYLINQPIIEEYIDASISLSNQLDGYNAEGKNQAYSLLEKKYGSLVDDSVLSIEDAKKMISGELINNPAQMHLLSLFRKFEIFGATMQQVMTTVNTDSKGVPMSLYESGDKLSKIHNLPYMDQKATGFRGMDRLIGTYTYGDRGEVIHIEPNTIKGFASIFGLAESHRVFSSLFPYSNVYIEQVINEINSAFGLNEESSAWVNSRKNIYDGIKSYMYSLDHGIFRKDVRGLRKDLLFNTKTNTSLANFFNSIKDSDYVRLHPFLSKLKLDLSTKGNTFSYLSYNAAANEDLDETLIYDSFTQMFLDDETKLGVRNGNTYTPKTFAEDLVAYSFLIGGIQDAKSIMKYIPTAYLKATGLGRSIQSRDLIETLVPNDKFSRFSIQYIQNNPHMVSEIDIKSIIPNNSNVEKITSFRLNPVYIKSLSGEEPKAFHTLKNKKGITLFVKTPSGDYVRIPILGEKLASEYYPEESFPTSSIAKNNPPIKENPQESKISPNQSDLFVQIKNEYFGEATNPREAAVLSLLSIKTNPYYKLIGDIVSQRIQTSGASISLDIVDSIALPEEILEKFKDKIKNENITGAKGSFNSDTNSIVLASDRMTSLIGFERVLLHESIHAITSGAMIRVRDNLPSTRDEVDFYNKIIELMEYAKTFRANTETERYQFHNEREFVTAALTEPSFQEFLNSIPMKGERKTLMDKVIEAVSELLQRMGESFGFEIKDNSVLQATIEEIITYINSSDFRIPLSSTLDGTPDFTFDSTTSKVISTQFDGISEISSRIKNDPTSKIKKLCQ